MVSALPAALALLSAVPWASAASLAARQSVGDPECRDVHVFLARGNNEPYPGRQGKLVAAICAGLDSCDYEDIQFWNPLEAPYCQSVEDGAANGTKQVTAYNKRCPGSRLVLSGYSQGGHVIGDILGGGGGKFFQDCQQKPNAGLDATRSPGNKISAVLIFGDVRHTANQPYNYLSGSAAAGLFPRPDDQLAGMRAYSEVTRSYCVDSDPICAGGDTVANHLNYFDVYSGEAGKWVQEVVGKAETSSTSSARPTATSTTRSSTRASTSSVTSSEVPATTGPTTGASAASTSAAAAATTEATSPAQASPTSDNSEASSTPSAPSASGAAGAASFNVVLLGVVMVAGLLVAAY